MDPQTNPTLANGARVLTYIDGFNLYYGLRAKGWRKFYWLDLKLLAENLLRPNQQLVRTRYFTARLAGTGHAKRRRQATFLEAVEMLKDVDIHYGHYLAKPRTRAGIATHVGRFSRRR